MARSPFTEQEVMVMITGTVRQVTKNSRFFYDSSVGPDYCRLTDEGAETLRKQLDVLMGHLAHAIRNDDEKRSKEIVFNQLKEK